MSATSTPDDAGSETALTTESEAGNLNTEQIEELENFEEQWDRHLEDIRRLKWNLTDSEDREELDELLSETKEKVETAKQNKKQEMIQDEE